MCYGINLFQMIHGLVEFTPGVIQLGEEAFALLREPVILPWGPLRGFYPFILQEVVVLQSGKQRIERPLHDDESRLLQLLDYVRSVGRLFMEQQRNAVLQHSLAHLRLYIIYIHIFYTLFNWLRCDNQFTTLYGTKIGIT